MTKDDLIHKYAKKCDNARLKKDVARKNKHQNKTTNPEKAHWDELEQEAYAKEFYLSEKILNDLRKLH